jgi:hypothetical protein
VSFGSYVDLRKKTIGAILMAGAICIGFLALSSKAPERIPSQWLGYRVLLVDKAIPESEILAGLEGNGVARVVSESTQQVQISDWSKLETMSLAAARGSVAPGDPRLDEYLQRLGLWFEAKSGKKDCRAYYIEGKTSGSAIARALEPYRGRYFLPDEAGPRHSRNLNALSLSLALIFMLASAVLKPVFGKTATSFSSGRARRHFGINLNGLAFRLSLLLPWAALAGGGFSAAAVASLWAFAFVELADNLDIPLEEFRMGGYRAAYGSLKLQGLPSPTLALCAMLSLFAIPGSIGSAALACLGSITAGAGYALVSSRRSQRRRFVPVPLGRYDLRRGASAAGKARGLLACVAILVWGLGEFLAPAPSTPSSADLEYPVPFAEEGNAKPTIAEARSRRGAESGPLLPGLASYLGHRAIQEALPYARVGEPRSDPFAELSFPMPGGESRVMSFDDSWARRACASLPPLGVEAMLAAQGGAVSGRAGAPLAETSARDRGRPLAPIRWLLYIFLLVPPLARLAGGLPLAREAPSGELRQEA